MSENVNAKYLTVTEVAAHLRMSPPTIRNMLRTGKLPGIRIHGSWRIERAQFEKKLEELSNPNNNNERENDNDRN